jgi:hypothetical protein
MRDRILICMLIVVFSLAYPCYTKANNSIRLSSPITSDAAGKEGKKAITSVVRVVCTSKNRMGTGFLHKSGNVITVAHIFGGCNNSDIYLITSNGDSIKVDNVISDNKLDLSVVKPKEKIIGESLTISSAEKLNITT